MEMKRNKLFFLISTFQILFIVSLILSIGCSSEKDAKEEEIKIGAILPLTGDAALYGENAKNAIELAKEEVNNSGGIQGRKLEIIYEDSQAKADLAVSSSNKLINVDHVQAIIGGMASSEVMAMASIMNSNKVILISPSATSHEITDSGDYIFRTIVSDTYDGTAMARFVIKNGFKSAAVFYVNEAGPEGVAKAFLNEFIKLGGNVVITETSQRGERDFRSQITKLEDKNIELVYFALYPVETEFFVRQYRELKINKPLFTHQLIDDPGVLKNLGTAADGILFTTPKVTPEIGGESVKHYYNSYIAKYKKEPQNFASNSYDALMLLANVMKTGLSSENIKQKLYEVKNYHGASGILSIDKNGDVEQEMSIMKIENSKSVAYLDN